MSKRLGRGYLDTGISRYDRAEAVDLFMKAIHDRCPDVLTALAEDVHDPATTREPRPLPPKPGKKKVRVLRDIPSPELAAWATTFHLKSAAIFNWASRTVESWQRHPEWKANLHWEAPPGPKQTPGLWSEHPAECPQDPLAPVGAMPEVETFDEFKKRAAIHWEARVHELKQQGAKVTAVKTNLDHFEWLARYQCGDESRAKIAHSVQDTTDVCVVTEAITKLATLLQLTLRPRSMSGKRNKSGAELAQLARPAKRRLTRGPRSSERSPPAAAGARWGRPPASSPFRVATCCTPGRTSRTCRTSRASPRTSAARS
jgi:hypothetical protein